MNGTLSGIVCAKCSKAERDKTGDRQAQVRHATIDEVRACGLNIRPVEAAPATAKFVGGNKQMPFGQHMTSAEEARVAQDPWREVRALQARLPHVEHMRYAIRTIDFERSPEPVWKFYQVDKPKRGKWAGRTFVSVMASDDKYPVRKPESLIAVLTAIVADPEKAVSDYGHQIGRCGICQRTLTDPESIERGIGPVCAGKVGW